MHNNYIKELAVKSYQEDLQKEYYRTKLRTWHFPSFVSGIVVTLVVRWDALLRGGGLKRDSRLHSFVAIRNLS